MTPLPADYPLALYRGDTRVWTVLFNEVNDAGETAPKDISGFTFDAEIRATLDSPAVMADIDDRHRRRARACATLTLSAGEALRLVPGTAYWDLQATDDDSVRTYSPAGSK